MKKEYLKIIDFKNHKIGLYNVGTFSKDWNNSKSDRGIPEKRCRIVKLKDEKVLEITIPKGTTSKGGTFWRLKLPSGLKNVTFEYDIMFGDNFNFVRGGKLPGLGGGSCPSGGSKDIDGFSSRPMWRVVNFENERYHLIKDPYKAYLVQYIYYPDKQTRKKWGKDFVYKNKVGRIFVRANKWYAVTMNIKLAGNPRKKDIVRSMVNGVEVLNEEMNLRKNRDYNIEQVMFELFFGGKGPSWDTKKDEKVYFRKFVINGR